MAAKRRKVVHQDLDIGYGATTIPTDSGGVRTASKVGLHSFSGLVNAGNLPTLQEAVTAAGTTGGVYIPASYTGSDTFTNSNAINVLDFRNGKFALGLKGFEGNSTGDRWAVKPQGFASTDSNINCMMEMGMPSSLSGGGAIDAIMRLNVGTSATALDDSRQRQGINIRVNADGSDKAHGIVMGVEGDCDGLYIGLQGAGAGQGIAVVAEDGAEATNGIVVEGFPDASLTGDLALIHITQHPATDSPAVLTAFDGVGLRIDDDGDKTFDLNAGANYHTASTGTARHALEIVKTGAGVNVHLRRVADGSALFCDDGSGNEWGRFAVSSGEPILTLTGYSSGAATLDMRAANNQQARINFRNTSTVKWQTGLQSGGGFAFYLSDTTRNRLDFAYTGNNVYRTGAGATTHVFQDSASADTLIQMGQILLTGAEATAGASQVSIGRRTQTTVGAGAGGSALPGDPVGYLIINVAGSAMVIPYWNAA